LTQVLTLQPLALESGPSPAPPPLFHHYKRIYLPLKYQHQLFVKVQAVLEDACYAFGRNNMGDLLKHKGWDSLECVELNIWAHIFASNQGKFESNKIASLGKSFSDLLNAVAQLRHTTVHRIRISARSVEQSLADAEQLAVLLNDTVCAQKVSRLRRETGSIVEELGRNKDLLKSKLADQLIDIASRRAELDRLEREAIEETLKEDADYQALAGVNLQQAMTVSDDLKQKGPMSKEETASDADADSDSSNEAPIDHE